MYALYLVQTTYIPSEGYRTVKTFLGLTKFPRFWKFYHTMFFSIFDVPFEEIIIVKLS